MYISFKIYKSAKGKMIECFWMKSLMLTKAAFIWSKTQYCKLFYFTILSNCFLFEYFIFFSVIQSWIFRNFSIIIPVFMILQKSFLYAAQETFYHTENSCIIFLWKAWFIFSRILWIESSKYNLFETHFCNEVKVFCCNFWTTSCILVE